MKNQFTVLSTYDMVVYGIIHKWCVCKCVCGNIKNILEYDLHNNIELHCGCLGKYRVNWIEIKYSDRYRLYRKLDHIKERCYNPNNPGYKNYGERGIIICKEWMDDKREFYNWSISHGWNKYLEIDRINNNGNYEPTNCRWVTRQENCNNTRRNRFITIFNETKTIANWVLDNRCKVSYKIFYTRIHQLKWNPEKALITEKMARERNYMCGFSLCSK